MSVEFLAPESIRTLGAMLQRSNAVIESEIRGASMGPTLPSQAKVRITCRANPDYQLGDVVAYWWDDALIAHRIVARGMHPRTHGFYLTRGDGHYLCDPAVSAGAILGRVSAWFDGARWLPVATFPTHGLRRWTTLLGQGMLEVHPDLARRIAAACSRLLQWVRRALHRP